MTTNLPAHLQNRPTRSLNDSASAGMSGAMPPHISIRANRFTLVGADGAKQTLDQTSLYACFVDISERMSKLYYEFEFKDGNDDPPTCWSANGVMPSREATSRQARTCAECQWNVRGSAVSNLSGKAIKACRDEKWTALSLASVQLTPQGQVGNVAPLYPDVLWQLRITPGSFKNFRSFTERCKSQGVEMNALLVRVSFEADKNGVLTFQPIDWISAALADIRDRAWQSKATDALVGRNDQPLEAISTSAPSSGSTSLSAPVTFQAPAAETSAQPARRQRRTKAEMEAARAGNGQPATAAPQSTPAQPAQPAAPTAPFRPEQPAQQPSNFGVGTAAPMPAGMDTVLDSFFGPPK